MAQLHSKKRGVTVVELLVVCLIIVILVAVGIPAMLSSKERGKATVCPSNLHQIGVANSLYQSDHGDLLPPYIAWRDQPGEPDLKQTQLWVESLLPYTKASAIFFCPSDPFAGKDRLVKVGLLNNHKYSSYDHTIEAATVVRDAGTNPRAFSRKEASEMIFIAEEPIDQIQDSIGRPMTNVYPHGSTINVLYLDWHSKAIPTPAFK